MQKQTLRTKNWNLSMLIVCMCSLSLLASEAEVPQFKVSIEPQEQGQCDDLAAKAEAALQSAHAVIDQSRELNQKQDELIVKLTKQRNEAIEMAKPSDQMPWYFWALVGGAATTILIRGVK